MGYGYQKRDQEIIDYELWKMDGLNRPFRGPGPQNLEPGKFFTCLGAAQTFGVYTPKPFPQLLSGKLQLPVLNAGVAGAGPLHFLKNIQYLDQANQSQFVIVQVMSGRSESNRVFTSIGGRGRVTRISDGKVLMAEAAYREFLKSASDEMIEDILIETRNNYVNNMIKLLQSIQVPRILLWFSQRVPDYTEELDDVRKFFGKYPQLVNQAMVDKIKAYADEYVESISAEGMPQKLVNRFTGEVPRVFNILNEKSEPRKYNSYYPSPEMHLAAYEKLLPVCRRFQTEIQKPENLNLSR